MHWMRFAHVSATREQDVTALIDETTLMSRFMYLLRRRESDRNFEDLVQGKVDG